MLFRYVSLLRGIRIPLNPGETLELCPLAPAGCTVTIRALPAKPTLNQEYEVVAQCEVSPGAAIRDQFESLSDLRLPPGSNLRLAVEARAATEEGSIIGDQAIQRDFLPRSIAAFISETEASLFEASKSTVAVLSWRHNLMAPISPMSLSPGGNQWSFDGKTWFPTPHSLRISLTIRGPQKRDPELERTQDLLAAGTDEPAGQELLREAWQHDLRSPRSALVIGFAALEVGFKEYASSAAPNSEWLLSNVQSPPVVKMLKDYLPTLPIKAKPKGKKVCIPSPLLAVLWKANELRNKVTHTSENKLDYNGVHEFLMAVQDVLWLLDGYAGHEWAFGYVRAETMSEMPDE